MKSIKRKLEDLRQQPEAVRMRAATLLTAVSGGMLIILWVAVLLPLQIKFNSPDSPAAETATNNTVVPSTLPLRQDVAGISTQTQEPSLPVATAPAVPSLVASPTPTPVPTEPGLPVEVSQ